MYSRKRYVALSQFSLTQRYMGGGQCYSIFFTTLPNVIRESHETNANHNQPRIARNAYCVQREWRNHITTQHERLQGSHRAAHPAAAKRDAARCHRTALPQRVLQPIQGWGLPLHRVRHGAFQFGKQIQLGLRMASLLFGRHLKNNHARGPLLRYAAH